MPAEIQAVLDASSAAGLPLASLEAKAREGLAKRVAPARIAAALDGMRLDLQRAAELLPAGEGDEDRDGDLSAAAHALRQGAATASMKRLVGLEGGLRGPALMSFGDLLREGFDEGHSLMLVESAASSRDPALALSGLATAAVLLTERGMTPASAMERLTATVLSDRSPLTSLPPTGTETSGGPPDHARNDEDNPGRGH